MLLKCDNYDEAKLLFDSIYASIKQEQNKYRSLNTLCENPFIRYSVDWLQLWYDDWNENELLVICEVSIALSYFDLKYLLKLEEYFISTLEKKHNECLALIGFIDVLWEYNNQYSSSCNISFKCFHNTCDLLKELKDLDSQISSSMREYIISGFISQLQDIESFARVEPHDIVYKYLLRGLKIIDKEEVEVSDSETIEYYRQYINQRLIVEFVNTCKDEFPNISFKDLYFSFFEANGYIHNRFKDVDDIHNQIISSSKFVDSPFSLSFLVAYQILNGINISFYSNGKMLSKEYVMKLRNLYWLCTLWNENEVRIRCEFKKAYKERRPILCNNDGLYDTLYKCLESKSFIDEVFMKEPDSEFFNENSWSINGKDNTQTDLHEDKDSNNKIKIFNLLCPNELNEDSKLQLLEDMKILTKEFKGVQFASFILAAVKNHLFMKRPSFEVLVEAGFTNFGAKSGYYSAYNDRENYYMKDLDSNSLTSWCEQQIKDLIQKYNLKTMQ